MSSLEEEAKVRVLVERCKGCGICICECPEKVLQFAGKYNSKGYEYVSVSDEKACKSCTFCALVCPEIAIHIYR